MKHHREILLIIIAIFFMSLIRYTNSSLSPESGISDGVKNTSDIFNPSKSVYTYISEIVINSDYDIEQQAQDKFWMGTGAVNDPFIIYGYETAYIKISGVTTHHYVIEQNMISGSYTEDYAIEIVGSPHGLISQNEIRFVNRAGIYVRQTSGLKIENNNIHDCYIGVEITAESGNLADNIIVKNNQFIGCNEALYTQGTNGLNFESNTIQNSILVESKGVTIFNGRPIIFKPDKDAIYYDSVYMFWWAPFDSHNQHTLTYDIAASLNGGPFTNIETNYETWEYTWNVQNVEKGEYQIRVTAKCSGGLETVVFSNLFKVEAIPPSHTISGPLLQAISGPLLQAISGPLLSQVFQAYS